MLGQSPAIFRHVMLLPLVALLRRMIAFEEIATIMIKGILQYFDLLVTGDTFIQNGIERVSRAPPETAEQQSFLLSSFLTMPVNRLFRMICVVFMAGIPVESANHFANLESWSVATAAIFGCLPIPSPSAWLPSFPFHYCFSGNCPRPDTFIF
jgi:hypothetical protein